MHIKAKSNISSPFLIYTTNIDMYTPKYLKESWILYHPGIISFQPQHEFFSFPEKVSLKVSSSSCEFNYLKEKCCLLTIVLYPVSKGQICQRFYILWMSASKCWITTTGFSTHMEEITSPSWKHLFLTHSALIPWEM